MVVRLAPDSQCWPQQYLVRHVPVRLVIAKVGVAENVGVVEPPVKFPKTLFAAAFDKENDSAGVVVDVATEVVNSGESVPAENDVTVPLPPPPEKLHGTATPAESV